MIMFADEVSHFSLKHAWKKKLFNNLCSFLLLGFIFDHIFGPKKDNLFGFVFVFLRGMSNAISDLVLYFMNILVQFHSSTYKRYLQQCSTLSLAESHVIFVKGDRSVRDLVRKAKTNLLVLIF